MDSNIVTGDAEGEGRVAAGMARGGRRPGRGWARLMFVGWLAVTLAGCGKFFSPPDNSGGGGSSGGGSGGTVNYLYVANAASASLSGFAPSSGTLAPVPNSPYSLSQLAPTALAITPKNTFLYVAAGGNLYGYSINTSSGALSQLSGQNGAVIGTGMTAQSMQVDATGQYLLAVDQFTPALFVFAINTSTGLLSSVIQGSSGGNSVPLSAGSGSNSTPQQMLLLPSNNYVYVALGTSGVDVLSFSAGSGQAAKIANLTTLGGANADYGLASDSGSTLLFVSETVSKGLRVLSIGGNGGLTEVAGSPFQTGLAPRKVLVDQKNSYVYVLNYGDNTISGYSFTAAGAVTALSTSPFAAGVNPSGIAEDSSGTYVAVTASGGNPDLQTFTFDPTTPGSLVSAATAATDTPPTGSSSAQPIAVVATH